MRQNMTLDGEDRDGRVRIPVVASKLRREKDEQDLSITGESRNMTLDGDLFIPKNVEALIVFAHGSGSGRHSARNQFVAKVLNDSSFATLLVDLLTIEEMEIDAETRHLRFDIGLLASRLMVVTNWILDQPEIG